MIYIGIDVGLNGGIAGLRQRPDGVTLELLAPAPTLDTGKGGTMHRQQMYRILKRLRDMTGTPISGYSVRAFIEKAHSMPKQGTASTFSFGKGFGEWLGILTALEIPTEEVTAQRWKKEILAGMRKNEKDSSIKKAQELYPQANLLATERSRVPHDGMAEALLIAEYNRRLR